MLSFLLLLSTGLAVRAGRWYISWHFSQDLPRQSSLWPRQGGAGKIVYWLGRFH